MAVRGIMGQEVDMGVVMQRNAAINKAQEMQQYALHLKKRLAGQMAVKNALRTALQEVAPNHPLSQPSPNQKMLDIAKKAMDATNWESDV